MGPEKITTDAWSVSLKREYAGGTVRGTSTSLKKNATSKVYEVYEMAVNTPHAGHYLQIAVPHESVDAFAYASHNTWGAVGHAYGVPDPDKARRLGSIKSNNNTVDGQARMIVRPDLFWGKGVKQWVYQYSRHAVNDRTDYIKDIQSMVEEALGSGDALFKAREILRGGYQGVKLVVRSHNVNWQNQQTRALVDSLVISPSYDFACLQELNNDMLLRIINNLPHTYKIVDSLVCSSTKIRAAMIFNNKRFSFVGPPFFGCFRKKAGPGSYVLDAGRPIMAAVFYDNSTKRRILVASMHAPHGNNYSLYSNMNHAVQTALHNSNLRPSDVSHFFIAGDFNREDWHTTRTLRLGTNQVQLLSGQLAYSAPLPTITFKNKARSYDNVLYATNNSIPSNSLDLTAFKQGRKHGSDHSAVTAVFVS